jgi:hypothetical protein
MIEHKEHEISRDPVFGHYKISGKGSGRVSPLLSGDYTNVALAKLAIDRYELKRGPRHAKTSRTSRD